MEGKFSLAHLTVPKCSVADMVYIAAMAGYDYISPQIEGLISQPELIAQTKKAMAETGVGIHDIALSIHGETTVIRISEPLLAKGVKLGVK